METFRLRIPSEGDTPSSEEVEARLFYIRQLNAINILIDSGREEELTSAMIDAPWGDLDYLIHEEDRVQLVSAAQGSVLLTVAAKSKAAIKSLSLIAPMFFDAGRQAVIDLIQTKSELAKIEVRKKELELNIQQAHAEIDIFQKIEKIKNPDARQALLAKVLGNVDQAALPPHRDIEND
ncbi:hypothetical protein D3C80_1466260 [compost metagenome]